MTPRESTGVNTLVHMRTRDTGVVLMASPAQGHKSHSAWFSFGGSPLAGAAMDTVYFQVLGGLKFLAHLGTFHLSYRQSTPLFQSLEEHA